MPTDDQHDNPFGRILGESPDLPRLDARSVIGRSRRRRLIQQVAVGGVATLAVLGVVGGIGLGFRSIGFGMSSASSAGQAEDGASQPQYSTGGGGKTSFQADGTATKPQFACGSAMPQVTSSPDPAGVSVDLRITLPVTAESTGAAAFTLTSTSALPTELRAANPIVVVGRAGLVTSVFSLDSLTGPQNASLTDGASRVVEGRLSASTCGDSRADITPGKDDILIVLPLVIDGENRWLPTAPAKVTVR